LYKLLSGCLKQRFRSGCRCRTPEGLLTGSLSRCAIFIARFACLSDSVFKGRSHARERLRCSSSGSGEPPRVRGGPLFSCPFATVNSVSNLFSTPRRAAKITSAEAAKRRHPS
jgi:hypothetical protein